MVCRMDIFLIALGAVGSIASIVGLFKFTDEKKLRMLHALYLACLMCLLAGYLSVKSNAQNTIQQLTNPEMQAKQLLDNADMKYSNTGFMLVCLAFLEKHKEQFPETYQRAIDVCKANGLTESKGNNGLDVAYKQIDGKSAMKSLLEGIAAGGLRDKEP
jgi:hypothetical protein